MVLESENNMKSRSLRVKHNPLIAFNESKSKLGKLPQLVTRPGTAERFPLSSRMQTPAAPAAPAPRTASSSSSSFCDPDSNPNTDPKP